MGDTFTAVNELKERLIKIKKLFPDVTDLCLKEVITSCEKVAEEANEELKRRATAQANREQLKMPLP